MIERLCLTQSMCVQMVDDGAAAAAALEAQRWGEAKRAALAEAQAVGEAALQQAASALVGAVHRSRKQAKPHATEQELVLRLLDLICLGVTGSTACGTRITCLCCLRRDLWRPACAPWSLRAAHRGRGRRSAATCATCA